MTHDIEDDVQQDKEKLINYRLVKPAKLFPSTVPESFLAC